MARVDLDARRAQFGAEDHVVVLDGIEYRLPAKLPLVVAQRFVEGDYAAALRGMFGEAHADRVLATISLDDLLAIAEDAYGLRLPESPASSLPSPNGGMRSTPTSNASTG
jgi:hypothetical protein